MNIRLKVSMEVSLSLGFSAGASTSTRSQHQLPGTAAHYLRTAPAPNCNCALRRQVKLDAASQVKSSSYSPHKHKIAPL
jgi:hypothetical protein